MAMHDECFESSLMTHVLPVRCVARRMKWAVGSARSATTAAAAARSKIWVNVIISFFQATQISLAGSRILGFVTQIDIV